MTISDAHLTGYDSTNSCREYTVPRSDERVQPKRISSQHTNWSSIGSHGHKYFDRYGIQIKIDSLKKEETQSWMVSSRRVDKYLTELRIRQRLFILTKRLQVEKLDAITQRTEQLKASSSALPIENKLVGLISVPRVNVDYCYNISKKMTRILRHSGDLREDDGAIEWRKLLSRFHRENPGKTVDNASMTEPLERGSNKKIFQCFFNSDIDDFVPTDCLEKVVNHKTGTILYQKTRLSPHLPPKSIF